MSDSLRFHGLYGPWNSPGRNTEVGNLSLLQANLPNPGIEPRSPALQVDSLPAEPPGELKGSTILSKMHTMNRYKNKIILDPNIRLSS